MIRAYVDGSYNPRTKIPAYGALLLDELDGQVAILQGKVTDTEMYHMRNVAGEITGAIEAIAYCVTNNIEKVTLYYDYIGLEYWVTGKWRTNNQFTQDYRKRMLEMSEKVEITFMWVKGHSGDIYNELADKLAKEAAGISTS